MPIKPLVGSLLAFLLGTSQGSPEEQFKSAYKRHIALQGLDYGLTLHALNHGAKELNPIVNAMPGSPAIQTLIPKVAVLGGIKALRENRSKEEIEEIAKGLRVANAIYYLLNVANISQTVRARGG